MPGTSDLTARYTPPGWVSLTVAVGHIAEVLDKGLGWTAGLEATAWLAEPHGAPPADVVRWLSAWRKLRDALSAGEIPALQNNREAGVPVELPPLQWASGFGDNPWRVPSENPQPPADLILVAEDPLRALIAALSHRSRNSGRTLTGQSPRAACRDWIEALAANGESPDSKDALYAVAQTRFPQLSRRGFDAAWSQAAPESWRKPGRR
tara:strand:- start:849 stop:1472 length:624 start_codon:yes stop_codon:yes gene_type:complete